MSERSMFFTKEIPRLRNAIFFCNPVGERFHYQLHRHDHMIEFLLICKGKGTFFIDSKEYNVSKGTLLCYNQGSWHQEESDASQPFEAIYISFSNLYFHKLPLNCFIPVNSSPSLELGNHFKRFEARMFEICNLYTNPTPESHRINNFLVGILLAELSEVFFHDDSYITPKKDSVQSSINTIRMYIHEHYHEPITLSTLAEYVFLSPYHLSRLFKTETGNSPIQYLINYRMDVALHLMEQTNMSVSEIAKRVGYLSEPHFRNTFKRLKKKTPGECRIIVD